MASSSELAPHDIGPTVAVVGTNGWRCYLCKTTFPRSFSIEHHMIMNHHPLSQLCSLPSSAQSSKPDSVDSSQQQVIVTEGRNEQLQETPLHKEAGNGCGKTTEEPVISVNEGMPPPSQMLAEPSSNVAQVERQCQSQCESQMIKTEPTVGVSNTSSSHTSSLCAGPCLQVSNGNCMEEGLPLQFEPEKVELPAQDDRQGLSSDGSSSSPEAKVPRFQSSPLSSVRMNGCPADKHRPVNPVDAPASNPGPYNLSPQLSSWPACRKYRPQMCCGQVFETRPEFRHHRQVVHGRGMMKTFTCHICCSKYAHKRGLNRHLEEKGNLPFPCTDCSEKFHCQQSLDSHRRNIHSKDNAVQDLGSLVNEDFAGSQNPGEPERIVPDSQNQMVNGDPWECSRCKKHFYDKKNFRRHLVQCQICRNENGVPLFYCNLCTANFKFLVKFHSHYVNDHKLASPADARNSPAHFSPYLGNSPVASPAPSVTSEINTALAGVDLNHSSASNVTGSSSPFTSTADIAADHSLNFGMSELSREEEEGGSGFGSNPQSLTSLTSTSEQLSAEEVVVVSDNDSRGDDSSSDSDSEWEMIAKPDGEKGHDTQKKAPEGRGFETRGCHRMRGHHFRMNAPTWFPPLPHHYHDHPHHPPPPPHHTPPPPHDPPPPPPPPMAPRCPPPPPFRHPPPPPRCHHHHGHGRWFGCRFWHGRGRGFHGLPFGASRFSGPGCFMDYGYDEDMTDPQTPTPTPAATSSTTGTAASDSCQERLSGVTSTEQETSSFQEGVSSEVPAPFRNFAPLFLWKGKHAEKKSAKKVFFFLMKNCLLSKTMAFCCPDCLQIFSGEAALQTHSQQEHSTSLHSSQYICFMCADIYTEAVPYNKHIHTHCKELVQHYGQGRGGGQGSWMKGHGHGMRKLAKIVHKALGPYGPPFARGHPLWEYDKDSNDSSDSQKDMFKECPYCKKKFKANSRENFFERHVNAHIGVETFNFKCEECGKTFLEKAKFTAHLASHKGSQFICSECGNVYQSKASLSRHQRSHNGERPYKCEVCGEGFIENRELVRHSMVHTGEAPFKCPDCGKGFTLKTSLNTHIKKQHPTKKVDMVSSLAELGHHQTTCTGQQASTTVKEEPASMDMD